MIQPTQYRTRLAGPWLDFPRQFHIGPEFFRRASTRKLWLGAPGRWPGSYIQVAALSWNDGTTWTIRDGLRDSNGGKL